MYERGLAKVTGWPESRPSAMSLRVRCALKRAPIRSARRWRTICPALCLLPAYSGPGLPSPAMIQRSSAMCGPPARRRGASHPRPAVAWSLLGLGLGVGRGNRLGDFALGGLALGRLGLDGDLHELVVEQAAGEHVAGNPDLDFNGDLLAAANLDQVNVLDLAPDGVALHGLRQRERRPAEALKADQRVRRLQRDHEIVLRQREVAALCAVAVHDTRHTTRPADTAGRPPSRLRARLRVCNDTPRR